MCWLIVIGLLLASGGLHAQDDTTLTNPIAYIGWDGNAYITDGETAVQITHAAPAEDGYQYERSNQPHWSPDGTCLVRRKLINQSIC